MTRITSRIFILLTACAAVTGLAFANPLQSSPLKPVDVENFIETMEYISAHEEEFAKTDALRPKASMEVLSRVVNDKGEIVMFRSMLPDLAKNPVEQRQLKKITKDAGFASLDHWALTGDRVFVAYMGTQVTEKRPGPDAPKPGRHDPGNVGDDASKCEATNATSHRFVKSDVECGARRCRSDKALRRSS